MSNPIDPNGPGQGDALSEGVNDPVLAELLARGGLTEDRRQQITQTFRRFQAWCDLHELEALPASETTILLFFHAHHPRWAFAHVRTMRSDLNAFHVEAGFAPPCGERTNTYLKALLRVVKKRKLPRTDPLRTSDAAKIAGVAASEEAAAQVQESAEGGSARRKTPQEMVRLRALLFLMHLAGATDLSAVAQLRELPTSAFRFTGSQLRVTVGRRRLLVDGARQPRAFATIRSALDLAAGQSCPLAPHGNGILDTVAEPKPAAPSPGPPSVVSSLGRKPLSGEKLASHWAGILLRDYEKFRLTVHPQIQLEMDSLLDVLCSLSLRANSLPFPAAKAQVASAAGMPVRVLARRLQVLAAAGMLELTGAGRDTQWWVGPPSGNDIGHVEAELTQLREEAARAEWVSYEAVRDRAVLNAIHNLAAERGVLELPFTGSTLRDELAPFAVDSERLLDQANSRVRDAVQRLTHAGWLRILPGARGRYRLTSPTEAAEADGDHPVRRHTATPRDDVHQLRQAWKRSAQPGQFSLGALAQLDEDDLDWVAAFVDENLVRRRRNLAYMLVGVFSARRHADLERFDILGVDWLEPTSDIQLGGYTIWELMSKTDMSGETPKQRYVAHAGTQDEPCRAVCPACALKAHLDTQQRLGRTSGPIFASYYRRTWRPLTRQRGRSIVRDLWMAAGLDPDAAIGTRSMRVGAATSAAEDGWEIGDIAKELTDHKTISVAMVYVRAYDPWSFQAALRV